MTSTNFSIGIEGRASSRVLKPPGGGHTDIFGPNQDKKTSSSFKQQQKSSVGDCLIYNQSQTPNKQEFVAENTEITNSIVHQTETKKEVISINEKSTNVAAPQRVRVPPGGFSSGLW